MMNSSETSSCYRVLRPEELPAGRRTREFAADVLIGLSGKPKALPSRYFYDEKGSGLFQQIMELPEYYLTNCEFEILRWHKERILRWIGDEPFNLVELGAGDGTKTKVLLEYFLARDVAFRYVPVDICEEAVDDCVSTLNGCLSDLNVSGLVSEYTDGLNWLSTQSEGRNVVLFLGSNIGNFQPAQAVEFLHRLWNALNDGDLVMIGFDLLKDIETIRRAYNDSAGVTAAFNLNLLDRINRELGADFDRDAFVFYSAYNVRSNAMESFLVSRREQEVHIEELDQTFRFTEWEPVQTEFSHKYRESEIRELARRTGFESVGLLKDTRNYFADAVWRVRKSGASSP